MLRTMSSRTGADRVNFWDTMRIMLPVMAGLLPLFVVWAAGGFYSFVWIGLNASPAEGFAIVAAICWPVAAHLYVRTQTDTIQGMESVGWPTVTGWLVQWEVKPAIGPFAGRLCRVTARYRYDLDGERYDGDLLTFGPNLLPKGTALDRVRRLYRSDMQVTVHHAPDDPSLAVLETGDAFAAGRMPFIWGLFAMPMLYWVAATLASL